MKRRIFLFLAFLLATFLFLSCEKHAQETQGHFTVCVSTYPIWLFTRAIMANSGLEPRLIVPADAGCPHDYALTPQDLMKVPAHGALLLANGGGLDGQIVEAIHRAVPSAEIIDTSAGIEVLKSAAGEAEEEHGHEEAEGHHHDHGDTNGHFFGSPLTSVKIVANIVETLAQKDAEHAALYRKNGEALSAELIELNQNFKATLESAKNVETAVQHDVFSYFFRNIGLKEPHVIFADPDVPLSPAELTAMSRDFKADDVKVIFTEPQYPEKMAQLISEETGVPVVKLDPVATGPEDAPTDYYQQQMRKNLELMRKAMVK